MFSKKKAILLIHGFVGGIYDFDNLGNELQLYKKFDVFSFTLPGHDMTIVKDYKYQDWIHESERQMQFLLNNGYKEIYIIGHSMGGVIAAYLASIYKEVKKLVLAAPAFGYFSFKDGAIDIKGFNNILKELTELVKEEDMDFVKSRIIKTPISTMIEFTKLVDKYYESVKYINAETLIIHGNNDQIVPKEAATHVYNNIKSKVNILYNVKEVNHNCFKGKRNNELKDIIINFLESKNKQKKETLNI
ncbi:MAG: alpha/beta fold hydrolase [Bacilli bacterium]|nr:alpha/beta fold hydrolase [Bacilli bacterium]